MARFLICVLFVTSCASAGCVGGPHQRTGAVLGTGLGALTGAVIGHESGHAEGGALIGGVIGGLTGSLAGQTEDHLIEQENAFRQASYQQQLSNALTNQDIVMMTHNQVGDAVIRNSIQTQGGTFDLSPEGIVALKQQGVSDQVIQAMQNSHQSLPLPPPTPAPVRSHTSSVIITPGFSFIEPHCDHHFYHRRYRRPRNGIHIHGHF